MGQSFDKASPEKTAAHFDDHLAVYHEVTDFYYKPFFQDSSFYIMEFRIENGDTVFKRTEKISYIIGSGQHTNSHIIDINGYIFQAPITYYTQKGRWDMAPGFDQQNLRFTRTLNEECITCHNHLPGFTEGSLNRFTSMPSGIECERCHGPGELHVKEMLKGNHIDTSQQTDYTIVNPGNLNRNLQMDICQRCHLQGIAVLEDEQSFFDFKPGMHLSDVMNVFLPRYSNTHEKFIMASQADRFRMSPCFLNSETFSCISCHHPHVSVKETGKQKYNNTCVGCHQTKTQKQCSAPADFRKQNQDDCVKCHMPPSGSIDIPHVRITDHFISKITAVKQQPKDTVNREAIARFLGLELLTKTEKPPLDMARGYIALYDKYTPAMAILDSAKFYLNKVNLPLEKTFKTKIHYHFAREEYTTILQLADQFPITNITDSWTAYRIGEAFFKSGEFAKTIPYYELACQDKYNLEFQEKLGTAYLNMRRLKKATAIFNFILKENPKRKMALCNLGYAYALSGKFQRAMAQYNRALAIDPDYVQALLNKAALLMLQEQQNGAKILLEKIIKIQPENKQVENMLKNI